ncbi:hypothetical protein IW150_000293 [Coemansia sp. RSA 2607]|nr:hypothetical protein IW150_000293 [Coemansia sp. RSA 2607]
MSNAPSKETIESAAEPGGPYADKPAVAAAVARAREKRAASENSGSSETQPPTSVEDAESETKQEIKSLKQGMEDIRSMLERLMISSPTAGGHAPVEETPSPTNQGRHFGYGPVPLFQTPATVVPEPASYADARSGGPKATSASCGPKQPQFGIRHWMSAAPIQYSIKEFCCHNMDLEASPDLYALLSGTSRSRFVRRLFGIDQIALDYYPEEKSTIVGCFLSMCPASRPTVRHPLAELNINSNNADENDPLSHVAPLPLAVEPLQLPAELPSVDATDPANMFIGEISGALDDVFAAANSCKVWHMLHIVGIEHATNQSLQMFTRTTDHDTIGISSHHKAILNATLTPSKRTTKDKG